jgi:2-succinyl-6-hydroxy-2,4-cyclohexadiene-1-carboxylate synthase
VSGVTVDGLRYEVRVRGEGLPLLLLHGFTGRGSGWAPHTTVFARHFRVTVVDLPGHGRSGTPTDPRRASVERTADDLVTVLRHVGDLPAHVVGYSLGARIAMRLAVAGPESVRRLVLESPSAGLATEEERRARRTADEALASRIERSGIEAFVDEWERQSVFASFAGLPANRQKRLHAAGLASSLRGAGQGSMEPLQDRLSGVRAPTMVIAGALDLTGLERGRTVAAAIPGARLRAVPDAGHAPHLERPSIFRSIVLGFLQEDPAA